MSFAAGFNFRVGDIVRFARGDNEYVGTVTGVLKSMSSLTVEPENQPKPGAKWRIGHRHVLRIERPVLSEKEESMLLGLFERGALTVFEANEVGIPLTGRGLGILRDRGLVEDIHTGVTSSGTPSWRLTENGERVARALHETRVASIIEENEA